MNELSRKLLAEARIHHTAGRLAQAEPAYRRLLAEEPRCADALYGLGLIEIARGANEKAVELITRALGIDPEDASKLNHLGEALRGVGRIGEAVEYYCKSITAKPDYAQAYNNLGVAKIALGDRDAAIANFETAVRLKPDYARGIANLAAAYSQQGLIEHAIEWWTKLLKITPGDASACVQLAQCLLKVNRLPEAIELSKQAISAQPNNADAYSTLASALNLLGRAKDAIPLLQKAVSLKPDDAALWSELGETLRQCTAMTPSIAAFARAIAIDPSLRQAHANLGLTLSLTMRQHEGIKSIQTALSLDPSSAQAHTNLLLAMSYLPEFEGELLAAESRRWGELHAAPLYNTYRKPAEVGAHGKPQLKIAYMSGDFRNHPVATFMEPILRHHDRSRFHITCYSDVPGGDAVTTRFKGLSHEWVEIAGRKDDYVADRVREDQIDVLVDIAGHTGRNRLLVMARKPAARQVTYLGYPGTTGMQIDARLTDSVSDPRGVSEALHTEPLVRVDPCAWAYEAPSDAPAVVDPPSMKNGYVTFGSFNNLAKITSATLRVWAKLIEAVPDSVLAVKAPGLVDRGTADHVRETIESAGIPSKRLKLYRPDASVDGHLGSYGMIDIALDPFPYNGTTTTCEALWMGVPVVTLAGRTHVSRVATSLLTAAGHEQWIAQDEDQYIGIARQLANDTEKRIATRRSMRILLKASRLCDTEAFTRSLETAYQQICGVSALQGRRIP